jgi:hypothetical protein
VNLRKNEEGKKQLQLIRSIAPVVGIDERDKPLATEVPNNFTFYNLLANCLSHCFIEINHYSSFTLYWVYYDHVIVCFVGVRSKNGFRVAC